MGPLACAILSPLHSPLPSQFRIGPQRPSLITAALWCLDDGGALWYPVDAALV